ncbi:beta-L-arabinofuranosidase domain-containing protein [Dyella acidiphila]|uniref:Glycoside hydrolase family 127 protein n=1 Tax=Dyella acidiphila TaxID=2775866 RepID=A0ABR9GEC0_9GAMM|nr:beta-L-arabinofuranosidase domain-containing protein [Dyella acidiphila]MBE1162373.1 glycoside hydrolase family 127 protein [Dyella acidiphila]
MPPLSPMSRRSFLQGMALAAGMSAMTYRPLRAAALPATAGGTPQVPLFPTAPLMQQPFALLPAGSIKAGGWLRRQLAIQAAGLGGHLDEFWPIVGPDSGWLGGSGESWEDGPYFLDGLVPLAWQLDSPQLKAKAMRFIDWTLDHPWDNGMFGPRSNDDWWPRMVMLKVLTQYHELTGDARVMPLMTRYFHYQLQALPTRPLRDWARMRWQDELMSVLWLYQRTQDPKLLELAHLLRQQGYDWQGMFAHFPFTQKTDADALRKQAGGSDAFMQDLGLQVHGVNNAQALKASPVWSTVSGTAVDCNAIQHQLQMLDTYHGLPNGMFSADEHLAGRSPSQGTELCTVVETMFSLEVALAITGDAALGDRLERIAFNALPAALTDDMWAHQYNQQPNQVECSLHRQPWTTDGPESNLFGLEPNFRCCTANFHQGWPKFANSLWMATADQGLAAMSYAPCTVTTVVRDVPVTVEQVSDYPFRQSVSIMLKPQRALRFPLRLRMPAWSQNTRMAVNGKPVAAVAGFTTIERTWAPGDIVEVHFDAEVKTERGYNGALSFSRGALVYALPIKENWLIWRKRGPTNDWQVYPGSRWNLGIDPAASVAVSEHPIGDKPFAGATPAVQLTLQGRYVPAWKAEEGSADPVPAKAEPATDEAAQSVTLVPYAGAKLRITAFPSLG